MLSLSGIKIFDDLTSAPVVKIVSLSDTVGKLQMKDTQPWRNFRGCGLPPSFSPPAVKERQHGFLKRQRERESELSGPFDFF